MTADVLERSPTLRLPQFNDGIISRKYHFLSLWYDLIPVSEAIGEHSNHYANGPVKHFDIYFYRRSLNNYFHS